MTAASDRSPGFRRRFLPVLAVGALGVLGLLASPPTIDRALLPPEAQELSASALKLLLIVNPLLLTVVAAAVGAACAHRVGLRSLVAGTAAPAGGFALRSLAPAALAGLVLAALIAAIDAAVAPQLGEAWLALRARTAAEPALAALLVGLLHGGLAEEVILRWGLMSLLAWIAMAMVGRLRRHASAQALTNLPAGGQAAGRAQAGHDLLDPAIAWAAILVSALAFGVAHLPAIVALIEPTPAIVARTVGLNLLGGIVYGWLFWRRGLEHAFAAHAATHAGFFMLRAA